MFFPQRLTHLVVMLLMIVKFMLIAFSSRSPCCYSPSVAPPFTSGLSCPGAVSICAGEPDQAQEVMDYIQHRYFISIQNRLEFRCRRQLPKLFLKKWQTGICTATAHHAADIRWSVRLRPCTAAHLRLTPRKTTAAALVTPGKARVRKVLQTHTCCTECWRRSCK